MKRVSWQGFVIARGAIFGLLIVCGAMLGCGSCEERSFEPPKQAATKPAGPGATLDNPAVPSRARPERAGGQDAPAEPPLSMPPAPVGPEPKPAPGMLNSGLLARFLYDKVADFEATGPAQRRTHETRATGAQMPTATRLYRKGDIYLKVQVIDAAAVPNLRAPITALSGSKRDGTSASVEGREVGGYPAALQWTSQNRTARVSLVLENRIVVNVNVAPTDDAKQAEALALALDLAGIAKAGKFASDAVKRAAETANKP